jgi:hypothetical protein
MVSAVEAEGTVAVETVAFCTKRHHYWWQLRWRADGEVGLIDRRSRPRPEPTLPVSRRCAVTCQGGRNRRH